MLRSNMLTRISFTGFPSASFTWPRIIKFMVGTPYMSFISPRSFTSGEGSGSGSGSTNCLWQWQEERPNMLIRETSNQFFSLRNFIFMHL